VSARLLALVMPGVVRFGRPRREARLETEAWAPGVVAFFERRGAVAASVAGRASRSTAFWRRALTGG